MPVDVFPVSWQAADADDQCRITAFGKTPDGRAACVHVLFTPFFYVKMPRGTSEAACRLHITMWSQRYDLLTDKCRVVTRKSLWGFQNGQSDTFAQLVFSNLAAFRKARWSLAKDHDTYEGCVDPIVRLFHLRGIGPSRWFRVAGYRAPARPVACVDLEIECHFTQVAPSDLTVRPPLVFGSWDIEARSASGRFPVADNPDDNLIQISTAFQRYGEPEPYARTVVCLNETAPVPGAEIMWSAKEHEVIDMWAELLREHKVDVLLGYNTSQFDFRFLAGRCGVLVDDTTGDPLVNTELLGRLQEGGGEVKEFELSSSAYGQNKYFVMQTPGVQQLDLLQYIRRQFNLSSYSLDNVSKHFLKSQKLDLPAAEIFRKFLGTPQDRADIAAYAVRDTELPLQLMAKLNVWENLVEMANAVNVPVEYLLNRGQQVGVTAHVAPVVFALGLHRLCGPPCRSRCTAPSWARRGKWATCCRTTRASACRRAPSTRAPRCWRPSEAPTLTSCAGSTLRRWWVATASARAGWSRGWAVGVSRPGRAAPQWHHQRVRRGLCMTRWVVWSSRRWWGPAARPLPPPCPPCPARTLPLPAAFE